jgi:hypothetical protein
MLLLGARSIAVCSVRALSAKKLVARARVATDLKTNGPAPMTAPVPTSKV